MLKIFLRPRLLFFSLILLFGFLGFVLAFFLGRQNYDDKTLQQAQIHREQTGSVLAEIPQESNQQEEPKDSFGDILVTRVIDGDTIEIEGGQRVRYIGIDTPETSHPQKGVECFGREASAENRKLVEGKKVVLEKDVSEIDKYGRLLRYVYARDTFVNQYLVIQGYAHSSSYPPDIKYQDLFAQAEKEARENNRGLWSGCKGDQQLADCPIKGNISSSGEKIYHMPGQKYYDKTVIDELKGECWFCTEEEAISAGWRKSKI